MNWRRRLKWIQRLSWAMFATATIVLLQTTGWWGFVLLLVLLAFDLVGFVAGYASRQVEVLEVLDGDY